MNGAKKVIISHSERTFQADYDFDIIKLLVRREQQYKGLLDRVDINNSKTFH